MTPSPMNKADFISSIILTLFGIGVVIESLRLPRLEDLNVNAFTVPGIVPGFIGVLLTICGLAILIRSIRRGGWRLGIKAGDATSLLKSGAVKRTALTLVVTLTYAIVLFPYIPFWIATPIFVLTFIVTAEAMKYGKLPSGKQLVTALILAVIAGLVIDYVFQQLFYVRLPGG